MVNSPIELLLGRDHPIKWLQVGVGADMDGNMYVCPLPEPTFLGCRKGPASQNSPPIANKVWCLVCQPPCLQRQNTHQAGRPYLGANSFRLQRIAQLPGLREHRISSNNSICFFWRPYDHRILHICKPYHLMSIHWQSLGRARGARVVLCHLR